MSGQGEGVGEGKGEGGEALKYNRVVVWDSFLKELNPKCQTAFDSALHNHQVKN